MSTWPLKPRTRTKISYLLVSKRVSLWKETYLDAGNYIT